jgi:AcrR family transcriptional regulator
MAGQVRDDEDGREGRERLPLLDRERFEAAVAAAPADPAARDLIHEALLERAALEVTGEVGFAGMTVEALVSRSGSNRDRLYRAFGDKNGAYLAGYAAAIEELVARVLRAGRAAPDWRAGMRRALEELAAFLEAEPLLARAVIAEPWAAGGEALVKRHEVFERLSRAIDRARRETDSSRHAPPPLTASFILSAIEAELLRFVRTGQARPDELVEAMLYVAVVLYFGPGAARAEVARIGRGEGGG